MGRAKKITPKKRQPVGPLLTVVREPSKIQKLIVRIAIRIVAVLLLVGVVWLGYVYSVQIRERGIAREIMAAGGKVEFEQALPAWLRKVGGGWLPVWERVRFVDLSENERVANTSLRRLKELSNLKWLALNKTDLTDAGLEHVSGLSKLNSLWLGNSKITDAGLEHLKSLTNVTWLDLAHTSITDAGLEHLHGLSKLRLLDVTDTKTTDEGTSNLRQDLPQCVVVR